ncbi:hypothetical protein F4777DRAFT_549136 [Nemania sp. FL0916]|nr:hypothetical protein F4777DRAFT_549136 [Nemania sp. FL0916]
MNQIPAGLYPRSNEDRHFDVNYAERWQCLKSVIVQLYLGNYGDGGKNTTLKQVVEFMKTNYSFHATPKQYRTHLDAWGIKKNVTKDTKDNIMYALEKRKQPGTSTSHITITEGGQTAPLRPDKLIRHIKEQSRQRPIDAITLTPGLLTSWNLPYEAFVASIRETGDKPSPFGQVPHTPKGMNIESPTPITPGREDAGPSPRTQLVYEKAREGRAALFLQARLEQLVVTMDREERKLFITYFHDLYLSWFSKARTWYVNQSNGRENSIPVLRPELSLKHDISLSSAAIEPPSPKGVLNAPTRLCRWSIHLERTQDDTNSNSSAQSSVEQPVDDFIGDIQQSIEDSSFTGVPCQDLPLAHDVIVNAVRNDPEALKVEAWKLAIMAGNHLLLLKLFVQSGRPGKGLSDIYPFHLAASFLDGGHECCKIFEMLSYLMKPSYAFRHDIDDLGHTILDALIVTILKSHTRVSPDFVSSSFRPRNRFPGEEIDICGRWGPDATEIRELFRQGHPRIPHAWKHPFCHTAVQAICHSIITIYGPSCAPDINDTSGLFIRRCTNCGLELKLGPLHTLVLATFYLADSGVIGETLFGAIAVLACLLRLEADATLTANISVEDVLMTSESGRCYHVQMSPLEFMQRVPASVVDDWTDDCKIGWRCFAEILRRAEKHGQLQPHGCSDNNSTGYSNEDSVDVQMQSGDFESTFCSIADGLGYVHGGPLKLTCRGDDIGLLWATVQAEILTYRQVREGDPWISENFSMRALEEWITGASADFNIPLVQGSMLREHSKCGWYTDRDNEPLLCATAEEISSYPFMNVNIYDERTTYTPAPELLRLWYDNY